MRTLLAPAHLALTVLILIWDILLAGRIAQNRQSSPSFQAVSGLAALLVLPGLLFALATLTVITGRAVVAMDWVWPAVLVLFAVQATFALVRRLVNPVWGIPIAIYDILIAAVGIVRFLMAHGYSPPTPLVTLVASQSLAMVFAGGTSAVLATPFYLNMPMVSPAFPALHGITASFRAAMSTYASIWIVLLALSAPRAITQGRNYNAHRRDQLHDRPDGDFAVGLKILPDIAGPPAPPAIRSDSALADTMDVDAVLVVIVPGVSNAALDSLAHVLDAAHGDSTTVIAAIGYKGKLIPELSRAHLDPNGRLATLRRVMSKLHPNIILPAEDPYGSGERALGVLRPQTWESYLTQAATLAKSIDRSVRVGVAASSYTPSDSALYAWAAASGSPIDLVGFSLFPSPSVNGGIEADTRTADRWMQVTPPKKDQWVFATGGYPLAYGERSQDEAVWQVLAWATDHPSIKGAVVYEAGDYGQARGLRTPNGRLRPVAGAVMRAIHTLRESAR